ncbi:hypothetical protein [Lentzea sp. NPDC003310]|uniref:hypothetical protein n=1 Tax=Lentzea sp. NPDC003310 TaxID=3154447 RepID=UPI0033A75B2C
MALIEKTCSVCHKVSWSNATGTARQQHMNPTSTRWLPCDTNGGTFIDRVRQS